MMSQMTTQLSPMLRNGRGPLGRPVNDSKAEFRDMANYPHVRLYRAAKSQPNVSAAELLPASDGGDNNGRPPVVGWSAPNGARGGAPRVDFSAVCESHVALRRRPRMEPRLGPLCASTACL